MFLFGLILGAVATLVVEWVFWKRIKAWVGGKEKQIKDYSEGN